jgi:CheY-like chemotaxis protein
LDDEPLIAMMLEDWVVELGHEVAGPAQSIEAALELCRQGGLDSAILDLSIDGRDSYEVADELGAQSVPYVFATGHGELALAPAYANTPVLSKPFDFDSVKAMLARLVP